MSCHGDPSHPRGTRSAPTHELLNSAPVKTIDDGLRTLIADMFEQMYDAPGIGLAI